MRASIAFVVLSALGVALPSQGKRQELDRARELLEDRAEKQVQEGTAVCVKANDVPAVELLLETLATKERRSRLHLSPGHYRDIVWDGLLKITDVYARRRVELELRTGRDPDVRSWCAELLGIYGDAGYGETLRKALSAKDEDVVRQAARSLGMLRDAAAAPQLAALCKHADDYVRGNAIEALARCDRAQVATFRAALVQDKSGGVRGALLGAAPDLVGDELEAVCTAALRDPDWRPRMQAVKHLGRLRSKTAVDALITALRDGRPVVAVRAQRELQELTGQPITQIEVWEKWWADHRAAFAFPEGRGVARRDVGTVVYNGVPVDSDHVAFLLDKSVQMQARLQSKGTSKDEAALAELAQVLGKLDDKIACNVFAYDTEVRAFEKKAVKLTAASRKRALAFATEKPAGKEKDIWQALVAVVADPTLDTAYLLSSGEPDTGRYVHWNRVTRHLADLNRFHQVTVHAVAYTDNEWYRDQIQKIAEVTGGHFEWFR